LPPIFNKLDVRRPAVGERLLFRQRNEQSDHSDEDAGPRHGSHGDEESQANRAHALLGAVRIEIMALNVEAVKGTKVNLGPRLFIRESGSG
jgi:hypothetical protein